MSKIVYFTVLLASLLWTVFAVFTPYLESQDGLPGRIGEFGYIFFSSTCHQLDDRSYHLFGGKIAVCARCISVYTGFTFAAIIYPFIKKTDNQKIPALWILISAAGLLFADAILDYAGVFKNTFLTRSITGGITGFILPFYIIPGFVNLFSELSEYFNRKKIV
ncbi:MAG: DUF2085 domain-containing protein [Ignavibacteriae bacterium]|nr:DUF2085 domain-containing protein [Ignavibacteriota bacterium]